MPDLLPAERRALEAALADYLSSVPPIATDEWLNAIEQALILAGPLIDTAPLQGIAQEERDDLRNAVALALEAVTLLRNSV